MKNRIKIFIIIVGVLGFSSNNVLAQRLSGSLGMFLNHIAKKQDSYNSYEYSHKLAFTINWYFKNILEENRNFSLGLRLCHFRIDRKETSTQEYQRKNVTKYQLSGLLLNHRLKFCVFDNKYFFIMNNSFGLLGQSIITDRNYYCDTVLCNFPDFRYSYAPGLEYIIKINDLIAIQVIAQYYIILGYKKDIFPFSSLFTFQIGLGITEKNKTTSNTPL